MNPISDSAPTADEALQRLQAGNILLPRLWRRCRRGPFSPWHGDGRTMEAASGYWIWPSSVRIRTS